MAKIYKINKRSISEAVYIKNNPQGDPFKPISFRLDNKSFLYGLGLGLYWGEGTKSNKGSIRLGNTDPKLVKKFISFLVTIYGIRKEKLRFGLQVFNDVSPTLALDFWLKELDVDQDNFQKVIVSKVRGDGNYKNKSRYGVLTVYFNNRKLRDVICGEIEKL